MRHIIAGRSKSVAIHESAHACLSVSFGHAVKRILVAPHPALPHGTLGSVEYHDFSYEASVDAEGLALAVLIAGAAERRLVGRHDAMREAGDREQAMALCSLMTQDAPTSPRALAHLDALTTVADSLVHRAWLWSWITAVANRSLASKVPLTGRDVQVIGEQVQRRKASA